MTTSAPVAPATKFQILVIEDDPNISRLLRENLVKFGLDCHCESKGKLGIDAFERLKPHLVLLDLMLPDTTGYEVCAKIRETSAVPIIIVSARQADQDQLHGLKLGADDYITKPFDPKNLMARVAANLRRVHQYDKVPSCEAKTVNGEPTTSGWLQCVSCHYMGPSDKFEDVSPQGLAITVCPHCDHRLTCAVV